MKVRIFQILGPPWLWLYGSWICNSNYLCNQCLSWLKLWASSWCGIFDTTLCDKVCQWLATGQWFSPGTPVYSTNKTDRYDIAKILLNVALNTITLTLFQIQSNPIWLKSNKLFLYCWKGQLKNKIINAKVFFITKNCITGMKYSDTVMNKNLVQ
jgi:hypothetical protein